MKQNLIKYYSEINNIKEEDVLKEENNLINLIKLNSEMRIFSFTYPIRGAKNATMLFYNCGIGEVARVFSEDNTVYCYEHNEKFKSFAKYVNEREDTSVTWLTNNKALKNQQFNIIVYEGGIDNLKQFQKICDLVPPTGWLLTSGINDVKEFGDLLIKNKLMPYFFHITKNEKIYLLKKE